ncbi:Rieske (2Fe-2S) protein [Paraburkholderia mimosarum]|uniref:hypothetical protein n=1 Tax=Paraburkholderia mimosarum TaxID=312026 RepID=UPI00048009CA|nr:hypothetical protein [Paraburkholderia mimosarum]
MFIAHEKHIPKTGDFLSTYMAEDPVVAARQKEGPLPRYGVEPAEHAFLHAHFVEGGLDDQVGVIGKRRPCK